MNSRDLCSKPEMHRLWLSDLGEVQCLVYHFRSEPPIVVLVGGNLKGIASPLVRIHSRCLYGEVFHSMDCDCREQLELAWQTIRKEGAGILIYLEQEGRGCGLISKAKAYTLKDSDHLDTVEAYRRLGLVLDARRYVGAAKVLKNLGINSVRLLTNNPAKVAGLVEQGIAVKQVNLRTTPTKHNLEYLRVKQFKLGHDLGLRGAHNEA